MNKLVYLTLFCVGGLSIALVLLLWGQPLICTCGEIRLWVGSIYDSGNSQHIADWYTLSHIIHGLLVALIWRVFFPRLAFSLAFAVALTTGVAWEIVEHTDWVLDAFRATTINQGYVGDSVLNAVADYVWMMGGFFIACRIMPTKTVLVILTFELLAALLARDSLILTTLMLVHPVDAVEEWQQALNPRN